MGADVVVIGAGPSGLAAAAMLAKAGRQVQVIARGHGFTHWAAGGIDVLGRLPAGDEAGRGHRWNARWKHWAGYPTGTRTRWSARARCWPGSGTCGR